MPDYKKIVAFFDEYIAHYREFQSFEYKKLDMINKNEIERLSDSLSVEQALIMKTNSLEGKRERLLAGIEDKTFAAIAENAPEEYSERLSEQHKELSALIFKIKEINDLANMIVSERLKKIQSRTAELDVYDGRGAVRREHASKAAISKNV
ncbi:MAG: flagellar protein FlgN [Prevotella sp.]|nr:flagellar protein FlgN [Prevotella sp.]